jgi:TRAP-type C4-dicarboxylate transport system permease small subunit
MKEKVIALAKILDNITFKLNGLSSICIGIITIFILAEIIARKFFNYGFLFVLEVSSYLLATSWFLSAAYTLRTDGHVRVNVLTSVLKTNRAARILDILATILGIVLCLIFFRAVFILATDSYFFHKTSFSPLRAPLYIPQTFIAIGMFFMLIQMIMRLMLLIINEKPDIDLKSK